MANKVTVSASGTESASASEPTSESASASESAKLLSTYSNFLFLYIHTYIYV
jgi:hypothetical protein